LKRNEDCLVNCSHTIAGTIVGFIELYSFIFLCRSKRQVVSDLFYLNIYLRKTTILSELLSQRYTFLEPSLVDTIYTIIGTIDSSNCDSIELEFT